MTSLDTGHGDQVTCNHNTEPDFKDEGRVQHLLLCGILIYSMQLS